MVGGCCVGLGDEGADGRGLAGGLGVGLTCSVGETIGDIDGVGLCLGVGDSDGIFVLALKLKLKL
jgi:hypothetical protein